MTNENTNLTLEIGKRYYDKCGHIYLVTNIDENAKKGYEAKVWCEHNNTEDSYNLNGRYSLACSSIYDLIGEERGRK